MGDDKAALKVTFEISIMNEGTKEERVLEHGRATDYASEEAKEAYKSLVLRNTAAREDIDAYTQHLQEKEAFKQSLEKPRPKPYVVSPMLSARFANEIDSAPAQPLTFSNLKSCFNRYPK
jgi:hypothetical protein